MLSKFVLYIVNEKNGTCRDVYINAVSSYRAREIGLRTYVKEYETIMCVYPYWKSVY